MRLLLDNTGLHRVHVVASTSSDDTITLSDSLALLHFAEHIMFFEGMIVSTFELPHIQDTSAQTIARLASHGCTVLSEGKCLLSAEDFSDSDYKTACNNAMPAIQEDLQLLDAKTVTRAAHLADFSTRPLGVTAPAMEKWVVRRWSQNERFALVDASLQEKARGAFDFIVASHDPIYRLIQDLRRIVRGKKKRLSLAMLLDVVFRVAINGQLSRLRGCTYAPAPQRANVTHETDRLFRHALERMIQDTVKDGQQGIPSRLINRIISLEQLPLPILALHFLGTKDTGSPFAVLDAARELRDSPDIVELRNWLNRWEALYNSGDLSAQEKALHEIQNQKSSLQLMSQDQSLFSVVRPEFSTGPDGTLSLSLELSGFAPPVAKILAKLSRRRVFLAAIRREIATDRELGARLCRIIGRPISTGI